MKLAAILLLASTLSAQPVRRALAPSPQNGWARVVVEDDGADGIWIGDAEGRSVPFLWEVDAHWSAIPLAVAHPIWGKDAKGQPAGAFTLQAPNGFARGDREQVKLDFTLQAAETPWVCRVEVSRRGDGGAFVALDDAPRFLYDLGQDRTASVVDSQGRFLRTVGEDRRATSLAIPWDADEWRVTLVPIMGTPPKLLGATASACTLSSEQKADERVNLFFHASVKGDGFKGRGHADLDRPSKLIALEVTLQPPCAPVRVRVDSIHSDQNDASPEPYGIGYAELWNLPAFGSLSTHIPINGPKVEHVHLGLPDGVIVQSATALIRHRRLFFPAEAGKAYFLHSGGLAKVAPGSLGELPASSRAFYAGAPLALGAAEADGQALVAAPDPTAKLRRWLPWGVGALVLLLGLWGLRLLKRD